MALAKHPGPQLGAPPKQTPKKPQPQKPIRPIGAPLVPRSPNIKTQQEDSEKQGQQPIQMPKSKDRVSELKEAGLKQRKQKQKIQKAPAKAMKLQQKAIWKWAWGLILVYGVGLIVLDIFVLLVFFSSWGRKILGKVQGPLPMIPSIISLIIIIVLNLIVIVVISINFLILMLPIIAIVEPTLIPEIVADLL